MCFSESVSFTAAAGLCIMGIINIKNLSAKNYVLIAAIPLLFAFQQLSEGILWHQLNHGEPDNLISFIAQSVFLVFAFLIWPIWIPLSLAFVEKSYWRRNILYFILACGIVLSAMNFYISIGHSMSVSIVNHSIQYQGEAFNRELAYTLKGVAYTLILLVPILLSTVKRVWLFGILAALSYVIATYFYAETFVSVWCFFAAVVSFIIYKVLPQKVN